MNERLQKKLNEMYLQTQRSRENAERQAQILTQSVQTASSDLDRLRGACELIGWVDWRWDGQNVVPVSGQEAPQAVRVLSQEGG